MRSLQGYLLGVLALMLDLARRSNLLSTTTLFNLPKFKLQPLADLHGTAECARFKPHNVALPGLNQHMLIRHLNDSPSDHRSGIG